MNQVLVIKLALQDHKDSPADRAHKDPQGHQDRLDQQAQLDSVDYGVWKDLKVKMESREYLVPRVFVVFRDNQDHQDPPSHSIQRNDLP